MEMIPGTESTTCNGAILSRLDVDNRIPREKGVCLLKGQLSLNRVVEKEVASVSIGITGLKLTVLCTINLFQQSTSNVENSIVVNNPPNCKFKCYLDK
jgi:hypothetical protein